MVNGHPDYVWPMFMWDTFGQILHDTRSYSEFVMTCELRGLCENAYGKPDERKAYDAFLDAEAQFTRGRGIMSRRAREFIEQRKDGV